MGGFPDKKGKGSIVHLTLVSGFHPEHCCTGPSQLRAHLYNVKAIVVPWAEEKICTEIKEDGRDWKALGC